MLAASTNGNLGANFVVAMFAILAALVVLAVILALWDNRRK